MAGLGLFLKQQQRDNNEVSYNNPQELLYFLQCSKSLKTFHPDLFSKYAFKENIDVLCRLQLENDLPVEISDLIQSAQNQLSNDNNQIQYNNMIKKSESQQEI